MHLSTQGLPVLIVIQVLKQSWNKKRLVLPMLWFVLTELGHLIYILWFVQNLVIGPTVTLNHSKVLFCPAYVGYNNHFKKKSVEIFWFVISFSPPFLHWNTVSTRTCTYCSKTKRSCLITILNQTNFSPNYNNLPSPS